jgi:hypothetical protein
MAMGKLLYEVKGGSHGQAMAESEVQTAADGIVQPQGTSMGRAHNYGIFHGQH